MIKSFVESVKSLKRNGWSTFFAATAVAVTLTLVGLFLAVLLNVERLATGVQNNLAINAYLAVDSTETQETITNGEGKTEPNPNYHQVYNQITAIAGVKTVTFSSKEEQLEQLKATLGNEWDTVEGNVLSDVYVVQVTSADQLKTIAEQIEGLTGVEEVNYGGLDTEKLLSLSQMVRLWGLVGAGVLVLVAVILIANAIKLTIMSRRRDIEIMRLVGAKNSYIRGPFFFEGAWIGLFGSILPAVLIFFSYQLVYNYLRGGLAASGLSLYPPSFFSLSLIAGLTILGVLIGAFGSLLAMGRYLKI